MKLRIAALFAAAAFASACDNAATGPNAAREATLLPFDAQATMDSATLVPRGPAFDNEGPPDALKLTDAQKAAIKTLHDAFSAAHKTQFDQLKAIHDAARAAIKDGKTREEVRAIMEKSRVIMESMQADFEALRAAVAAVLTPEQQAWAAAHRRQEGGPMGGPALGAPGGPMGPMGPMGGRRP
jgi:Spy/CpxP family protein refolding chaperone